MLPFGIRLRASPRCDEMRVTLILPGLNAGGTERVASIMANYWAAKGWEVNLLTLDDGSTPPFYDLDPGVVHEPLGIRGDSFRLREKVWNNLSRVIVLRQAIRQTLPQAVISFLPQTNVLSLLATTGMQVPVIISERTDPYTLALGPAWHALARLTYPRAASLVAQTNYARNYYPESVKRRSRVIPNPLIVPMPGNHDSVRDGKTVIAMGRLQTVKGFDLLLQAFARVAPDHPGWSLEIWGEGPARPMLDALVSDLGLAGRVRLPGRTSDTFEKMRAADLFVLSSRIEGFPNVLAEAMGCGLPTVSFDIGGLREIVRDGTDGVLVPPGDFVSLADAMGRLMDDGAERRSLAEEARKAAGRWGIDGVMALWEDVIRAAMSQ